MRLIPVLLATAALAFGAASAHAAKGNGGGTPPSYSNCTTDVVTGNTTCTATNPAGRRCTQIFNAQGESIYYRCEKV